MLHIEWLSFETRTLLRAFGGLARLRGPLGELTAFPPNSLAALGTGRAEEWKGRERKRTERKRRKKGR